MQFFLIPEDSVPKCAPSAQNIITQELAGKSVQDSLSSDPVLVRMNSLEREKTQLEYMLGKEHQSRKDLAEWNEKNSGKDPCPH